MILLFCFLMLFLIVYLYRRKKRRHTSFKVALKPFAYGIIFGKVSPFRVAYSPPADEGHVLLVGSSGSAKTSSVIIPTLKKSLKDNCDTHAYVIDISDDIEKNVQSSNKLIFEPENPDSIPYDIFYPVDQLPDKDRKEEYLINLAFLILPENVKASDSNQYFLNGGRKILISCLLSFYPKGFDFMEIIRIICSNSYERVLEMVKDSECPLAVEYLQSFAESNPRNVAGCLESLTTALALFRNPVVKRVIRRPKKGEKSITMDSLENYSVFIKVHDSRLATYSAILRVLTIQTLNYLSEREKSLKSPILIVLDEVASLGYIDLVSSLRKLRKRHVRVICASQAIVDLDLVWSREERIAMLANFSYRLCLRSSDPDTAEYFSRMFGADPEDPSKRAIPPEELDRLEDDLIMAYPGGWIRLRKNYYFKFF